MKISIRQSTIFPTEGTWLLIRKYRGADTIVGFATDKQDAEAQAVRMIKASADAQAEPTLHDTF